MELKYRRIYALIITLLFFVIAPLLVLYTTGYRYDSKKKTIIRTGVLTIDSKPRDAIIVLNGKTLKKKTPAVIKNLVSQEYEVELKKEGYYSWKKTLTIFSHQATLTNKVTMLKRTSSSFLDQDNVIDLQISPQKSFLAFLVQLDQNNYSLVVKRLGETNEFIRLPFSGKINLPFSFSRKDDYLFVPQEKNGQNSFLIIFLKEQKEPFALEEISPLSFTKIEESPISEEIIYALSEGKLFKVDLRESTIRLLFDDAVEDFVVTEKIIYYISRKEGNVLLKRIETQTDYLKGVSSQELLILSSFSHFNLEENLNGTLTLLDQQNNRLSLIESKGEFSIKLKQLNPEVVGFRWSEDGKKLLFYNDFELWVLNTENEEQELFLRSSEKIKAAEWYFDETWILFQQANKIKAIELDSRDKRNIIELTDAWSNFITDSKRKELFFIGQEDYPNGLYSLKLD